MTKLITFTFYFILSAQLMASTSTDIAYKLVANSPINPEDRQVSYENILDKLTSMGLDDFSINEAGEQLLNAPVDVKLFLAQNLNIQSTSLPNNTNNSEVVLDTNIAGTDTIFGGMFLTLDTLIFTTIIIIPLSIDAAL